MTLLRKPSCFFQRDIGRLAVGMAVVVLFSLLFSDYTGAVVYQCKGKSGVTVLTDRPGGLQDCVQIQTLAPSPTPSSSPTSPPTSPMPDIRTPSLDQDQRPPAILPDPTAPPPSARGTFKDLVPPQADTEKPPAPTASDTQPCASRINPLNPLAGGNCPPAAVDPPAEPKNP